MKKIFIVPGGLQCIAQLIGHMRPGQMAKLEIVKGEAPDNTTDGAFTHTSLWDTSAIAMVDRLNEKLPAASFVLGGSTIEDKDRMFLTIIRRYD